MNNTLETKPQTPASKHPKPLVEKPTSLSTNQNVFKQSISKTNIINSFIRNFYSSAKIGIHTTQTAQFCTHLLSDDQNYNKTMIYN